MEASAEAARDWALVKLGVKGIIRGFDSYVVLLESDGKQQMIFKHAISTVTPSRPVQYSPSESDGPANPSEEEI